MGLKVAFLAVLFCLVVLAQNQEVPNQFEITRVYSLSRIEAGVVNDVRNTRDKGERTFDFNHRILTRNFFLGQQQSFDSLDLEEKMEIYGIATNAIEFLKKEKKSRALSSIEQEHEKILTKFLLGQ